MNYVRFINRISSGRKPSILREMTKAMAAAGPDMIPLSTGLPHADAFPFTEARFRTVDGAEVVLSGAEMKRSLQYQTTGGVEEFVQRLTDLQERVHQPPENTWKNSEVGLISVNTIFSLIV